MKSLRFWAAMAACLGVSSLALAAGSGGTLYSTMTTLSASPNPASSTQSVRAQAIVAPPAEGTMNFMVDGQLIGSVAVTASVGDCPSNPTSIATSTCTTYGTVAFLIASGRLSTGDHVLTANFVSSTENYTDSDAAPLTLTISAAAGSATLPAVPVSTTPVSKYEYDAEGNPTKTIAAPDGRNLATQHGYDSLGRRTTTTNAKNGVTQFGYDLLDQPTSVTDPRSLATQYQTTALGDVTQLTSPDTGIATSTYDAAGNLKTRTDARGVLATYSYDVLNRPTQVVYSKTGDTSRTAKFTYDQTGTDYGYGVGRLTTMQSPDVSTAFRYDALGQVTATKQIGGNRALAVAYEYDGAGRITKMTYPSGRVYNYTRVNGQVQSISQTAGTDTMPLVGQIVMGALGQPVSWTWTLVAGQPAHVRVYDTSGRMVRHPLGLLVRDITYDDADRVSRFTHYTAATAAVAPAYDQSFGYDELDRLVSVTGGTNWSYAYDATGNRTASSAGSTARGYTVATTSNRLSTLTNPVRSMGYDEMGNTLSDIETGSSANYTARYTLEGRLAAMTQGTTAGIELFYDADGRRVVRSAWAGSSSNPRTVTLYAYDLDSHLIGEYNADGTPITEYIWLGDIPVAMIKLSGATATMYAIHTDHLNTPRVAVDISGQVRWRWLGEPFGASPAEEQPTSGLAAVQQNLRFPGQQYEAFGGRYYNHFRDYDPTTGRYVQSDPIGLNGGINTYAYVGGNPVSGFDVMGLANGAMPNQMVRDGDPASPEVRATAAAAGATVLTLGAGAATGTLPLAIVALDTAALADGLPAGGRGVGSASRVVGRGAALEASSALNAARLRMLLKAEQEAGACFPAGITGYRRHGLNQAISRDGVGVAPAAILDAINNPVIIVGQDGGRFLIKGRDAALVINKDGEVMTTWARNSAGVRQ